MAKFYDVQVELILVAVIQEILSSLHLNRLIIFSSTFNNTNHEKCNSDFLLKRNIFKVFRDYKTIYTVNILKKNKDFSTYSKRPTIDTACVCSTFARNQYIYLLYFVIL